MLAHSICTGVLQCTSPLCLFPGCTSNALQRYYSHTFIPLAIVALLSLKDFFLIQHAEWADSAKKVFLLLKLKASECSPLTARRKICACLLYCEGLQVVASLSQCPVIIKGFSRKHIPILSLKQLCAVFLLDNWNTKYYVLINRIVQSEKKIIQL